MLLVKNRYYSDYGLDYVFEKLTQALKKRDIELISSNAPIFGYGRDCECELFGQLPQGEKEVVFWDKDVRLARVLESRGIRLLPNSADALEACDDKELTYSKLAKAGITVVKTIGAPLVFDVNLPLDNEFLDCVEKELGYPIVIKENTGSQGKQVYLAKNRDELKALNQLLIHKPHIYQEFRGEYGCDIRVYVLDGEAVCCALRRNTTDFKSNIAMGGNMERFVLTDKLRAISSKISKLLKLNYGSVDFLLEDAPIFIEANSNAYFKGIEMLGVPIADMLGDYIFKKLRTDS